MPEITLTAETGRPQGSAAARRLRAEGKIPGVLYGHGGAPVALAVDRRDLRVALAGEAAFNTLLRLQVDGRTELALIKDLQRHPVKRSVTHVDFVRVNANEEVTVEVPIVLEGEARQVSMNGGLVDPALNSLTITATADHIPNQIVVDISGMAIGDIIRIGDLVLPTNVTTALDPETPVVTAEAGSVAEPAASTPDEGGEATATEEG